MSNVIRKLRPDDRAVYLALAHDFYRSSAVLAPVPDAYLERTFDELTRSDAYVEGYLLEREGRPVGYGLISKSFSQEVGGVAVWLEELYLLPGCRGLGFGHDFFALVESTHPEARAFRLEVEPENTRAAALYQRLGYQPLGYQSYRKVRK